MRTLPQGVRAENNELQHSQPLELIKVRIETEEIPVIQRLCLTEDLNWQGEVWVKSAFSITGIGDRAGGEKVRPRLMLPNPEGIYSYYIQQGFLDNALITYYRVHPSDIDNGENLAYQFYVARITEHNRQHISCQLNALSDGNNFKLPSRRFVQPEFNLVRL